MRSEMSLDIDDLDVDQHHRTDSDCSDASLGDTTVNTEGKTIRRKHNRSRSGDDTSFDGEYDYTNDDNEDDSSSQTDHNDLLDLSVLTEGRVRVSRIDRRRFEREFAKELPDTEKLCRAFTCALSKEILFQGKMFVTPKYVCFYSKLFNITQKLIIPFVTITKLEPRMTINFIPNGIAIYTTKGDKHIFASFSNRNRTLDILRTLRNAPYNTLRPKPLLRSPSTISTRSRSRRALATLAAATALPVANAAVAGLGLGTLTRTRTQDDTSNKQDAVSAAGAAATLTSPSSSTPHLLISAPDEKRHSVGESTVLNSASGGILNSASEVGSRKRAMSTPAPVIRDHAPTSLPDPASSEKVLLTETVQTPLPAVANLLFGDDTRWLRHFLSDVEKNKDVGDIPKFPNLAADMSRYYEYTKPLNGPVGPKQTKCKCTERITKYDLETYVDVVTITATPDVPSGGAFTTLTHIAIAWGPNNSTKIRMGTWLEWTGKSWLKGPIEKGAVDGQTSFCKALVKEISKKARSSTPQTATSSRESPKPERSESPPPVPVREKRRSAAAQKAVKSLQEWQRLCTILAATIIFLLLVVIWLLFTRNGSSKLQDQRDYRDLQRVQEELNLWQWIDDRKDLRNNVAPVMNMDVQEAIAQSEQRLLRLKSQIGN